MSKHRATLQQGARLYHLNFQQELHYHMSAQAQSESLLAAEQQHSQKILQEQAENWEAALCHHAIYLRMIFPSRILLQEGLRTLKQQK